MVEEKKTTYMWIKVDLQCHRCRKKIKKVLCKFPQIQDQEYKEKENLVVIKVVCCSPEKVKQKIICKGGDTIKSIEIREIGKKTKPPEEEEKEKKKKKHVTFNIPEKQPEEEEEKRKKKKKEEKYVTFDFPEKPPEEEKKDPELVSKLPPGPVCVPVLPGGFGTCCTECYEGRGGGPCLYGHGTRPWPPLTQRPHAKPVPLPVPVPAVPAYLVGFGTCCTECYQGRDGGPCHYGHGRPAPCYDGYYYGRPIYDSYGGGYRSCYTYVSRCEETSPGCIIM